MDLQNFFDEYGNFNCSFSDLSSLEGVPKKVKGSFNCTHTKITSLKGSPECVDGNFDCYVNKLVSLEGAPEYVGGVFDCSYTGITSLKGAPKKCSWLFCYGVKITKKQVIDYLRHNNCMGVDTGFGVIYKKDIKIMEIE